MSTLRPQAKEKASITLPKKSVAKVQLRVRNAHRLLGEVKEMASATNQTFEFSLTKALGKVEKAREEFKQVLAERGFARRPEMLEVLATYDRSCNLLQSVVDGLHEDEVKPDEVKRIAREARAQLKSAHDAVIAVTATAPEKAQEEMSAEELIAAHGDNDSEEDAAAKDEDPDDGLHNIRDLLRQRKQDLNDKAAFLANSVVKHSLPKMNDKSPFVLVEVPLVAVWANVFDISKLRAVGFQVKEAGGYPILEKQLVLGINIEYVGKVGVEEYAHEVLSVLNAKSGRKYHIVESSSSESQAKMFPGSRGFTYYWLITEQQADLMAKRLHTSEVLDWGAAWK